MRVDPALGLPAGWRPEWSPPKWLRKAIEGKRLESRLLAQAEAVLSDDKNDQPQDLLDEQLRLLRVIALTSRHEASRVGAAKAIVAHLETRQAPPDAVPVALRVELTDDPPKPEPEPC